MLRGMMTELSYTCGYRKHWDSGGTAADEFDRIKSGVRSGSVTQLSFWEAGGVLVADELGVAIRLPSSFDRGAFLRMLALHGVRQTSHMNKSYKGSIQIRDGQEKV